MTFYFPSRAELMSVIKPYIKYASQLCTLLINRSVILLPPTTMVVVGNAFCKLHVLVGALFSLCIEVQCIRCEQIRVRRGVDLEGGGLPLKAPFLFQNSLHNIYEVQSESSWTILGVSFVFKEERQNFAH